MKAQFLNATSLSNSGERITIEAPGGVPICDFTYADSEPWPAAADGHGRSLVLIAPRTNPNPNDPLNWRPSTAAGGNPGTTDAQPPPANPLGDDDLDGWQNLAEYGVALPGIAAGRDATDHLTLSFIRNLAADDAIYVLEKSDDLATWNPAPAVERVSQAIPIGATAVETWRSTIPAAGNPKQFLRLRVQLRP